jgi:hypothetical protein
MKKHYMHFRSISLQLKPRRDTRAIEFPLEISEWRPNLACSQILLIALANDRKSVKDVKKNRENQVLKRRLLW